MDLFTSWYNILAMLCYLIVTYNFHRIGRIRLSNLMLGMTFLYAALITGGVTSLTPNYGGIVWAAFNVCIGILIMGISNESYRCEVGRYGR